MPANKSQAQVTSAGIGFLGLLNLILITLKLLGKIPQISWWWVWAPFWGPVALVIAGLIVWIVYKLITGMRKRIKLDKQIKDIESITVVKQIPFEVALSEYAEQKHINRNTLAISVQLRRMELWKIEHPNEPMPTEYQPKSRWQERLEEMQRSQQERLNRR